MLPLSLFIILLTFFLTLMPQIEMKPEKVGGVLESVERVFKAPNISLPLIKNSIETGLPEAPDQKEAADETVLLDMQALWPENKDAYRGGGDEIIFPVPEAEFFANVKGAAGEAWAQAIKATLEKQNGAYRIDFFVSVRDLDNKNKIKELESNLQVLSNLLEQKIKLNKRWFSIGIAEGAAADTVMVILRPHGDLAQ